MSTAKISSSTDLVLRILGGPQSGTLFPVKTASCVLADSSDPVGSTADGSVVCSIKRNNLGASIHCSSPEIKLNGEFVEMESLTVGDRIEVGKIVFEVLQLGSLGVVENDESNEGGCSEAAEFSASQNSDSAQNCKPVDARIEELETQLSQQHENFDSVNKRFDELNSQMATLLNAINHSKGDSSDAAQQQPETESYDEPVESCCKEDESSEKGERVLKRLKALTSAAVVKKRDVATDLQEEPLVPDMTDVPRQEESFDESTASQNVSAGSDLELQESRGLAEVSADQASLDRLLSSLNSEARLDSSSQDSSVECELPVPDDNAIADDHVDEPQQQAGQGDVESLFASLREKEQTSMEESEQQNENNDVESPGCPEEAIASQPVAAVSLELPSGQVSQSEPGNSTEDCESEPQESVADVLARMECVPDLADLEEPTTIESNDISQSAIQSESVTADSKPESVSQPATENDHGNGGDVQDYMQSLLQRLGGGVPNEQTTTSAEAIVPSAVQPVETDDQQSRTTSAPEGLLSKEEFVPSQVALEIKSNLAAMREIANASTRSALKSSQHRRKKEQGGTLLLAAGGSIFGAVTTFALSQSSGDMFYWLSIMLFAATVFLTGYYAKVYLLDKEHEPSECGGQDRQDSKPAGGLSGILSLKDALLKKLSRDPKVEN